MLYLENEEIKITDEGMCLEEIKDLYSSDRRQGKPFFKKCITFLFWGYKKDGIWANMFPKERLRKAAEKAEMTYEEAVGNKKLMAAAKIYIELDTTLNERLYLGVKQDMEDLLEHLRTIPFKKKTLVELNVDIPSFQGSTQMIKYPVREYMEMDNSDEKRKAMKNVQEIIALEENLRKSIMKEYQQKRVRTGRLFDTRSNG